MGVFTFALAICIVTPAHSQSDGSGTFQQSRINELLDKRDPFRRQLPSLPDAAKPPGGAVAALPTSNLKDYSTDPSDSSSINCAKITTQGGSAVARLLCNGRDAASADWDLNAVLWAIAGTKNEIEKKALRIGTVGVIG